MNSQLITSALVDTQKLPEPPHKVLALPAIPQKIEQDESFSNIKHYSLKANQVLMELSELKEEDEKLLSQIKSLKDKNQELQSKIEASEEKIQKIIEKTKKEI